MGENRGRRAHCGPSRVDVSAMFDRVAPRYDLVNRLLSTGIDGFWRKKMAACLPPGDNLCVLDLATGTADQLLALFKRCRRIATAVGLDLAENMLSVGREKVEKAGLTDRVSLKTGDAQDIDAPAEYFDAVTISFGIRNVKDPQKALKEMARVLKPGGRALVLEFSLPQRPLVRRAYLGYLRVLVPAIGGWISGDPRAYRYLNRSIEAFPSGSAFLDLVSRAGFVGVAVHPMTFGIASIYHGDKPIDRRLASRPGGVAAAR